MNLKITYCLTCTSQESSKEHIIGICSLHAVLGIEEQSEKESQCILKAYFSCLEDLNAARKEIENSSIETITFCEQTIQQQDWNQQWRDSITPVCIRNQLWISPPWLQPPLEQGQRWIKIEPKMAFGTGHHETTRLASGALIDLVTINPHISKKTLLDIGCGSGILSFIAEYYGFETIVGIDNDSDCLDNLSENRKQNASEQRLDFVISSLGSFQTKPFFEVIISNMIISQLQPILPHAVQLLTHTGVLIWSGVLIEQKDEAIHTLKPYGMRLCHELTESEWWCGTFTLLV